VRARQVRYAVLLEGNTTVWRSTAHFSICFVNSASWSYNGHRLMTPVPRKKQSRTPEFRNCPARRPLVTWSIGLSWLPAQQTIGLSSYLAFPGISWRAHQFILRSNSNDFLVCEANSKSTAGLRSSFSNSRERNSSRYSQIVSVCGVLANPSWQRKQQNIEKSRFHALFPGLFRDCVTCLLG